MIHTVEKSDLANFHEHNFGTIHYGVGFKSLLNTISKNELVVKTFCVVCDECIILVSGRKSKLTKFFNGLKCKFIPVEIPCVYIVNNMLSSILSCLKIINHIFCFSRTTSVTFLDGGFVRITFRVLACWLLQTVTSFGVNFLHVTFVG